MYRFSHACELSASLDPVGGKSNYSKRDRKLSQSRSNPSIYIAQPGASADERERERRRMKGDGNRRDDESWGRSTRGLQGPADPSLFFSLSLSWRGKTHAGNIRWLFSFFLAEIFAIPSTLFSTLLPPLAYLSIRLRFSHCAKRCNRTHVYTRTFARAIFAMWMQRRQHSDVNVTTGHVATFNNAAKLRGMAGESDRTMIAGGANATLRRNRGCERTADGLAGRLVSRRRPQ